MIFYWLIIVKLELFVCVVLVFDRYYVKFIVLYCIDCWLFYEIEDLLKLFISMFDLYKYVFKRLNFVFWVVKFGFFFFCYGLFFWNKIIFR